MGDDFSRSELIRSSGREHRTRPAIIIASLTLFAIVTSYVSLTALSKFSALSQTSSLSSLSPSKASTRPVTRQEDALKADPGAASDRAILLATDVITTLPTTTITATVTMTATASITPTSTSDPSLTALPTITSTSTSTPTMTSTADVTITSTSTSTPTMTSTADVTITSTQTTTSTSTVTPTDIPTASAIPSETATPTASATATATDFAPPTSTPTLTNTPPPTSPPTPTRADVKIYLPITHRLEAHADPIFGVQVSELRFRDTALIDTAVEVGAAWYRTFFYWDEVEPVRTSPPTYDWRHYDPIITHASERGLRIIAEMSGNPPWAADVPGGPVHDLDTLAEFMAAAVERYDGDGVSDAPGSPVIRHWELYNEPDNRSLALARQGRGWGWWGDRGDQYALMLKRVYPVIKLTSPEARVVFGGVAWEPVPSWGDPFDLNFIDDVLAAGGGPYFDDFNIHFYPIFAARWAEWGPGVLGKTLAARAKLLTYGLDKPILVTEAGTWSHADESYPPTSPRDQARYVPQLYSQAMAGGVRAVVWYHLDDVEGTVDPLRGLVDGDLGRKESFSAYRLARDVLGGAVTVEGAPTYGASGEVYTFRRGAERIVVAWSVGPAEVLAIPADSVERIHFLGNRVLVRDSADGVADGVTHVPFGTDPIYVIFAAGGG